MTAGGRILSYECKATLFDQEVRMAENIDFQFPMKKACSQDIQVDFIWLSGRGVCRRQACTKNMSSNGTAVLLPNQLALLWDRAVSQTLPASCAWNTALPSGAIPLLKMPVTCGQRGKGALQYLTALGLQQRCPARGAEMQS